MFKLVFNFIESVTMICKELVTSDTGIKVLIMFAILFVINCLTCGVVYGLAMLVARLVFLPVICALSVMANDAIKHSNMYRIVKLFLQVILSIVPAIVFAMIELVVAVIVL